MGFFLFLGLARLFLWEALDHAAFLPALSR